MPLMRRIPKRGFNSKFPRCYQIVNLSQLKAFKDGDAVDPKAMMEKDIIKRADDLVKVLGDGEIKKTLTVSAHRFSKSAKKKIEKAGGKVTILRASEASREVLDSAPSVPRSNSKDAEIN